jgi:hypothetical protein
MSSDTSLCETRTSLFIMQTAAVDTQFEELREFITFNI